MPCDLGYRNYSRIRIPAPQPKELKTKSEAPKIDADLLAKIGEDDTAFLEWMRELNIEPLLQEALRRAIKVAGPTKRITFYIAANGDLIATAKYLNDREKKKLEEQIQTITNGWQMEVLSIAAELLDYEVVKTESNGSFTVEGEKHENSGVHKYLRIERQENGDSAIRFEHFKTKDEAAKEKQKFLGLSQKLGVKIRILDTEERGAPIPHGAIHKHFLKEGSG